MSDPTQTERGLDRKFLLKCSACGQVLRWTSMRWGMRWFGHRWDCKRAGQAPDA